MFVISCVLLLGFASASLTSYFSLVNANKNGGYVHGNSDYNIDENPTIDVDEVIVDPYHFNAVCFFNLISIYIFIISIYLHFIHLHLQN